MPYTLEVNNFRTECSVGETEISFDIRKKDGVHKVSISILDVIGITQHNVPASKKTSLSKVELNFIQTDKKPPTWTKGSYTFQGDPDVCTAFESDVTKKVQSVEQRPKHLLVIINPISGGKNGRSVYRKVVEPLFNLAMIKTNVIYTERANHITEIVKSFDFSTIDGIVLIGGDGGYQECINTLLKRTQEEAGIDYNNPEVKVKPIEIPIGLIPAGTGNGVANVYYKCLDHVTAALHIIKGCRLKKTIAGAYSGGKHINYFGLVFGFGLFSDMMDDIDQKRWMGRARYLVGVLSYFMVKSPRQFDVEITCYSNTPVEGTTSQQNQQEQSDSNPQPGAGLSTGDDANSEEFSKTVVGTFMNIGMWLPDMTDDDFRMSRDIKIRDDRTTLNLFKPCGRLQNLGYMKDFATVKPDAFRKDFIQNYKVTRWKCKIKTKDSRPEVDRLNKLCDLDGEMFEIPKPEFEVRLFPGASFLFCGT